MFYIVFLLSLFAQTKCAQPYFPPQITFVALYPNINLTFAIDQLNQRAFLTPSSDLPGQSHSYAMKHIPDATPGSPQSKYYVLLDDSNSVECKYSTVWQYGHAYAGLFFPSHWHSGEEYTIGNYIQFRSEMILVNDSSPDEDYWRSVADCALDSGETTSCEEIYFKKNTEIPLRYKFVKNPPPPMLTSISTVNYQVISIGKPDDRLFKMLPQNWKDNCTDLDLGFDIDKPTVFLNLNASVNIRIRITTPPHIINGNDTMLVRMQLDETYSECTDCVTWEPKEFYFNSENFHEYQNMTVTRVKAGFRAALFSAAQGGGYEKVKASHIYIL